MKSVDDAPEIGFFIPPMPQSGSHHVISRSQRPDFYRTEDLRDKGPGKTAWVDTFEKILAGLHWVLEGPVPYAFRTPDGAIRSLDAGCIKMLLNRKPPEIEIICDTEGYIQSISPSAVLLKRYALIRDKLVKRITGATADEN